MKYFFLTLATLLFVLSSIVLYHFSHFKSQQKAINVTFALTHFPYFSINSNFFEPSSYDFSLSHSQNRAYPTMMQINKLDFIYE
jgi:hypothetical protein